MDLAKKSIYYSILGVFLVILLAGVFYATHTESTTGVNQVFQKSTVLNLNTNPQALAGFNVLSMSTVDMSSSSPWLRGEKMWMVSVVGGGVLDQQALVRVTPSTAPVTGKEKPEHEFTIQIKSIQQSAEYPIMKTSEYPVYRADVKTWSELGLCEYANAPPCGGMWAYEIPTRTGTYVAGSFCAAICLTPRASKVGKIENPTIHSSITTGVYGGENGQSYDGIIDSSQNVMFRIGPESNPMGVVVWQGGTVSGLPTINQNDYKAIFSVEGSPSWKIVDKSLYTNYNSLLTSQIDTSCVVDWPLSECSDPNCLTCYQSNQLPTISTAINNKADAVMNDNSNFGTIYQSGSLDGAKVKVSANGLWNNPVLTYYLKASWIGIYTPSPKAQIMGTGSACFNTGEQNAEITVDVKNVGDEHGNFFVSASCPSPFSTGSGYTIGLDPQKQTTVHIPLQGGPVNEKTTKDCTITVSSIAGEVKATQQVCIDPDIVCQKNTKECIEQRYLWQCNEFGTARTQIADCSPQKCVEDELGARCEDPTKCNGNKICESDKGETVTNCGDCQDLGFCKSCTDWFFSVFKADKDKCTSVRVFETKCKWYDVGCNFHNMMVPAWTQDQFCPWIVGMFFVIIMMIVLLIVIVLKKKGIIGKGGFSKSRPYKSHKCKPGETYSGGKCIPGGSVGWRGK